MTTACRPGCRRRLPPRGRLDRAALERLDQQVPVERRLEHLGRAGELRRAVSDPVHLHVVRVAVVAVPVVHHQDRRRLLAQHGGEPLAGFVERRLDEAGGVAVGLPSGHPRIVVAEPHDAVDTKLAGRPLGLGAAPGDDRLAVAEVVRHLAVVAIGRDYQHHTVPLGGGRERSIRPC